MQQHHASVQLFNDSAIHACEQLAFGLLQLGTHIRHHQMALLGQQQLLVAPVCRILLALQQAALLQHIHHPHQAGAVQPHALGQLLEVQGLGCGMQVKQRCPGGIREPQLTQAHFQHAAPGTAHAHEQMTKKRLLSGSLCVHHRRRHAFSSNTDK